MDTYFYSSTGILQYSENPFKLIVKADQGISNFYRALIPKWIKTNPQKYPAHISVVRKEIPVNLDVWRLRDGEEVEFSYNNTVFISETYCWINIFCKRLEEIRSELGLPVESIYTRPPDGFSKVFHMTIANFKGL